MDMIVNLLKGYADKFAAMIPPSVLNLYANYKTPLLIALIALCVMLSLEGYKIFKGTLYIVATTGLGFVGAQYVAGFVVAKFGASLPAIPYGITYEALIPVAMAVIGVFLVKFAYKFTVMLLGGGLGFALGFFGVSAALTKMFPTLGFLSSASAKAIVGLVFAAIFGVFFILFFKHLFIITTSFGCMIAATSMACMILVPAASDDQKFMAAALGAIIAIYSTIHQYNEEQRATDIRFFT